MVASPREADRENSLLLLLTETLKFAAAHSPFYAQRIGHQVAHVLTLDDLARLPTTSKTDLISHSVDMLTPRDVPAPVGFTSGSTFDGINVGPSLTFQSASDISLITRLAERAQSGTSEM